MPIQFKRGTADKRKINTDVLVKGQPFFETDTNKLYMGDGTTALKSLKPIVESSNNEFTGDNVFRGSCSFFNSAYFGSGATFNVVANATFGVKGTGYYLYQTDVTTNDTAQLILGGTTEDSTTTSYKVGTIVNKQATLTLPTTTGTVALTNDLAQIITITSTTLTDDQLTAITSSDLNKIKYGNYIYSLYEIDNNNRIYTANYLTSGRRLTINTSTKAVTTGALNSLTSHYTAYNYVGAIDSASNAATTNGNTYLKLYENGVKRSQFKIVGSGATTVSSDANGNITISSTDNNTDTNQKVKAKNLSGTDVTFGSNDVVEFVAGSNVTITPDATNKKITIASSYTDTNTAHSHTKGVGLVVTGGGGTSGSVEYKAALASETLDTNAAVSRPAADANRTYPVIADKNGKLAVIVPWTANSDGYVTAAGNNTFTGSNTFTGTNKFNILKSSNATNGLELNFYNSQILFKDARHSNYGTLLQADMAVGYGTTNVTITLPSKTGTLMTNNDFTYSNNVLTINI